LEAVNVSYVEQPGALFDPPPGFATQDLINAEKSRRKPIAHFGPPEGASLDPDRLEPRPTERGHTPDKAAR
jgi:hypothetical protein